MQYINRKEFAIKTLLILISILSIILIKEGVNEINSSIKLIENMGGFDIYPMDSTDITIRGWYYSIIVSVLFTIMPIIVLILSIVSMFMKNNVIEVIVMIQTLLTILLEAISNYRFIGNTIDYYTYIGIVLMIILILTITSFIKRKCIFAFYIAEIILLFAKYIDVYKLWYNSVRGEMSLLSWFDKYNIEYSIIAVLGFVILILKFEKRSNAFSKS